MTIQRVILIVIDGCGVGELPDASLYNDKSTSTLSNCAKSIGGLHMPVCQSLGLGNIVDILGIPPTENPIGCYGKMEELSCGKDSTIGHWEISGIITDKPFPTYPNGFPKELIHKIEKTANIKTVGNIPLSGTEIIERLGEHHLRTKEIILYTSADSVLQIAAHEDICSVEELYKICEVVRTLCTDEHAVGRVIARPFKGSVGNFKRTTERKDFSLKPPSISLLNYMLENNHKTLAIGKINDLFAGNGISASIKTKSNLEGLNVIKHAIENNKEHSLIFANLVEFDELWGHRRNPTQFANALEEFDTALGNILPTLHNYDLLIITADHGCDPTYKKHTDHTREYVPLLVYNKNMVHGKSLGIRKSFADISKTVTDIFQIENGLHGTSFQKEIRI